jgi:hypothetical protein
MGVDAMVIIGHKLKPAEIINFPKFIDQCQELKDIFIEEFQSKIDHHYSMEQILLNSKKESHWGHSIKDKITEEQLLKWWNNNRTPNLVEENGYIGHFMSTYFGRIYFLENTVCTTYLPEHKYANLFFESHRRFMLRFSRAFAKLLGETKIVYCSEAIIANSPEDLAFEGNTIENIIETSISKLWFPSDLLVEAIPTHFFIDDVMNPVKDFEGDL